jgi:hypothetical protein
MGAAENNDLKSRTTNPEKNGYPEFVIEKTSDWYEIENRHRIICETIE